MNEQPDFCLDRSDLNPARRVDAICRRFETDWRAGRRQRIDDYLADDPSSVPDEARRALHAELDALEHELRHSDHPMARPESTAAPRAPLTSMIAEAPTIAPGPPPTLRLPGAATSAVHEEATMLSSDDATVELGAASSAQPEAPSLMSAVGLTEAMNGLGAVNFQIANAMSQSHAKRTSPSK